MTFLGSAYRKGFLSSSDSPVRLLRRWGSSKKRKTAGVIGNDRIFSTLQLKII